MMYLVSTNNTNVAGETEAEREAERNRKRGRTRGRKRQKKIHKIQHSEHVYVSTLSSSTLLPRSATMWSGMGRSTSSCCSTLLDSLVMGYALAALALPSDRGPNSDVSCKAAACGAP